MGSWHRELVILSELVIKKDFQEVVTPKSRGSPGKKGQEGIPCQENTGKRMKKHRQPGNQK